MNQDLIQRLPLELKAATSIRPTTLLKKRLWDRLPYCEFCKISNTPFTEHLQVTVSVNPCSTHYGNSFLELKNIFIFNYLATV